MSIARGAASLVGTALGKSLALVDQGRVSFQRARQIKPGPVSMGGGIGYGRAMSRAEAKWLGYADPGGLTAVSESRALAISTVWACLKNISEDIARCEFRVVKEVGHGLYQPVTHPLNQIINWRANREMSAYSFWECMVWNMELRADAFAEIESSRLRRVKALWPIPTLEVEVYRDHKTNELLYNHAASGVYGMTREAVLHLHNLSADGIMGLSWLQAHASTTLARPAAISDFVTTFFKNYCKPLVAMMWPENVTLEPAQKQMARDAFMKAQSGDNIGTPAVLDRGVKIETFALDLQMSQVQELLEHSPPEICAIFRMPPHKVGILDRSTNNNIEAQDTQYSTECLGPRKVRVEGEASMLVDGEEQDGKPLRVELDDWELIRGAQSKIAEIIDKHVRNGTMTRNEARAMLGRLGLSDAVMDEATIDVNLMPASEVYNIVRARAIKDGQRDPGKPSSTPAEGGEAGAAARSALDADLVRSVVRQFAPAVTAGYSRLLRAERDKFAQARDKGGSGGDYARRASEIAAGGAEAARGVLEPIAASVEGVLQELVKREGNASAVPGRAAAAMNRMSELYRLSSQSHAIEQQCEGWDEVKINQEASRRAMQALDELAVCVTTIEGD